MDVDDVGVAVVVRPPHLLEELRPADHHPRAVCQGGEDLELDRVRSTVLPSTLTSRAAVSMTRFPARMTSEPGDRGCDRRSRLRMRGTASTGENGFGM